MIPMMPHAFVTGQNLDVERVNDNLEAGARDLQRNLDKRYTYCGTAKMVLDGVTAASAAVLRQLPIRRPGASNAVEVFQVEVVLYGAGAAGAATLACSDTSWPSLEMDVVNGATTEVSAISDKPVSISSSSSDTTFTLTLPAAYTVTAGYILLHLRCDRGNQGTSHSGYTPTLLNSNSSTAGSTLDDELNALATAVGHDTANDVDLRCETFTARGVAAGTTTLNLPSGARRYLAVQLYCVVAVGTTGRVVFDGTTVTRTGAGATVLAITTTAKAGTMADAPMTAASDSTVALSRSAGAGTIDLLHAVLWWS